MRAEGLVVGADVEAITERLTHYFAEINAIHPFREGNGRIQRAFFHQLSREAGWPIDWSELDQDENVRASMASLRPWWPVDAITRCRRRRAFPDGLSRGKNILPKPASRVRVR